MHVEKTDRSNFVEILRHQAEFQPQQSAYIFLKDGETESNQLTYEGLDRQARAIAVEIAQMQIPSGSRVILLYPYTGGCEFIAAFFGCLYAGAIAVPCHLPRNSHAVSEVQARIADSEAQVILTTKSLLSKLQHQITPTPSDKYNSLHWIATDTVSSDRAREWRSPKIDRDTLAFLQYTSGSTGQPKGVKISHGCLLQNQKLLAVAFNNSETTISVGWLPLFHDMGLIGNVLHSMYIGRPCILMSPIAFVQKPVRWLQAISRYRATTSGGPNFAYDLLCRHVTDAQREPLDLSCWEIAFSGAEPIRSATIDRFVEKFAACGFRREAFYPCYGMAEATLLISGGHRSNPPIVKYIEDAALEQKKVVICDRDRPGFRPIIGCGQAWLDVKIVIADPDSLTQCFPNQIGEIWVSSSGVGGGYWNQPEETQSTFQAYLKDTGEGPFLRTGDLGFLHQGELFITGRLNDVMVFWGFNHYPQLIEQTVENCHRALRANGGAAISIEVNGESRLVILHEIERNEIQSLRIDELVETIRWAVFQEYFIDVYSIALLKPGSLPKTSSGKIQRRACRTRFLEGKFDSIGEWRSPANHPQDMTSLLRYYLNPMTHVNRYFILARGRLQRVINRFAVSR